VALGRYRAVQFRDHFAVKDLGEPESGRTTTVPVGTAGAGSEVPLYVDRDDAPIVWRSAGNGAEDCAAAVAEADRRNVENEPDRSDFLGTVKAEG